MRLAELIADMPDARVVGDAGAAVRAVRDDSRKVEPGDVFVAVRGLQVDGHAFVGVAVEQGAAAVVVERELPGVSVPQVIVAHGGRALGWLAQRAVGRPSDQLVMVGITGTNGKTTTTYLLEAIFAAAGGVPGVIGTVNYRMPGKQFDASFTTPTAVQLAEVLAAMKGAGCTHVAMEATSSALFLDRLEGLNFRVGAFSNLTQDHLDVHGTMAAYFEAKALLFAQRLTPGGAAVAMVDDADGHGEQMLQRAPAGIRRLRVSISKPDTEIGVIEAESSIAGIRATLRTPRGPLAVRSRALFGEYNLSNLLLAVGICEALDVPHAAIAAGIEQLAGVPGRVERVVNARGLDVFVDYAHTPDALERVIAALRPLTRGRLIAVFGCGGDRDPTKRPKMGRIVAQAADLAVVTSDNPRTEAPDAIIDMIVAGMNDVTMREPAIVEPDRRKAITAAVRAARPGQDVVLIAGKGHEDYQILGKTKIHFDDREEAAAAIAALPAASGADAPAPDWAELVDKGVSVVIDHRQVKPGDVFVAIKGENFDGYQFARPAAQAGASVLVVGRGRGAALADLGLTVVEADDTRAYLQQMAAGVRRAWGGKKLVAVTGSAGKTTTKELIAAVLRDAFPGTDQVVASEGSLNNETGVPLTLLRLTPRTVAAVVEMGMRGLGQIDELREIARPDVGVVLNAGLAHVGVIGSVEAIADGKAEMWNGMMEHGVAVYPVDDPRLAALAASKLTRKRHITFGDNENANVHAQILSTDASGSEARFHFHFPDKTIFWVDGGVPFPGAHNVKNAAAALAVAAALKLDLFQAAAALAHARNAPHRSAVLDIGGRHVFDDCYNANPASMHAAVTTVAELAARSRLVAVVGDMLELGDESEHAHEVLGQLLAKHGAYKVVAMGASAEHVARGLTEAGGTVPVTTDDPGEAARTVARATAPGDWILIKASRGMRLERVIDALRQELE